MKEKTTLADKYLLEHFYGTCSPNSKKLLQCTGVKIEVEDCEYSWIDVILDGHKKCGECPYFCERQGFYYGKGEYSDNFSLQKYVTLNKIRSQEEFENVCAKINPSVKGMVIRAAIYDASVLEQFTNLEFVVFEGQRISHFWNTTYTPNLKFITVWMNKYLKSLAGLENAQNLECLQFYVSFSDISIHKIGSLEPISKLPNLKEIVISATEPLDHNIDYLINLPSLEYMWISPNLFPTESYAKFEAKKFKLSDEYGIYCEDSEDIFPYGKGKRVMHTAEQKERYLNSYNELLKKYKEESF